MLHINPAIYAAIFLPLIIILIQQDNTKKQIIQKIIKRKKGDSEMFEIAQRFINKKCIVYTYNSQIAGVITEVTPGAILLVSDKTKEAVNFDFIMRIREYPTNKNGKEKSIVID